MCLTTAVLPFLQAAMSAVSMFSLICRFPNLLYLRFTSFADLPGLCLLTVVTLYVWLSSISRPCTMPPCPVAERQPCDNIYCRTQ